MIRPGFRRTTRAAVGVLLAAFLLAFGACSLNEAGREEVSAMLERHEQQRSAMANGYADTPKPARPGDEEEPRETVAPHETPSSLSGYIALALGRNPDIKAAVETARAAAERVPQVTSLPDPIVGTRTFVEPVRPAEGDNYFNLNVSQKLPPPAKLDTAGRIAVEETRMALDRLRDTRQQVIADVKRTYFRLYVQDRSIEILGDNQQLLAGLIDVARAQVAAGRRSQDDVLRAQVELSGLESELIRLRQGRSVAAARLNQLLDRPTATSVPSPEDYGIRDAEVSVDELVDRAAESNPALSRLRHQIEREREAAELARLARWPDFTIGFTWMQMDPRGAFEPPRNPQTGRRPVVSQLSEDGSDNWAVTFGFNVPIWFDRIEAGIEEARRRLSASEQEYASAKNEVSFRISDALERVHAQAELARLFRDTIIPQAEQAYRVSQGSYSAGTIDFLDVIDNWREWLTFNVQYYRSLGELERSVADLEQAIGMSLSEAGASE
jgi:outer membrane protein TolC